MPYLDQVVKAPPNTIERRLIGTTSEARRRGCTVPKEASEAAWRALKPLKLQETVVGWSPAAHVRDLCQGGRGR